MTRAAMAIVGLTLVVAACHPTAKERSAVRRWLLCEECREGELQAVVALGDRVATPLQEALRGPPASGRENIRLQAEAMFRRIPSPVVSQAAYVDHFVANYVATYQSRAMTALEQIGSARAHAILLEAVRDDSLYRADVRSRLLAAAQVSVDAVDSTPQVAPVLNFVRADPSVRVMDARDSLPRPLANVRVTFRIEVGGGVVLDSVRRTGPNGVASARWQLGPGEDSVNVLRAEAVGATTEFRATGRTPDPRVVFTEQPTNVTEGDPFTPSVKIAVLDGWDQVITQLSGVAILSVAGAGDSLIVPMVAGRADFPGFILSSSATGLRLRARVAGAREATSQAFDVLP